MADAETFATTHFEGPHKFVCAERPNEYSYYTKYDIDWSGLKNYQV